MRRGQNRSLAVALLSALTLGLLALAYLAWQWLTPRTHLPVPRPASAPERAPAPDEKPRPPARARPATPTPTAAPRCKPAAAQRCVQGDVWLVDGCGNKEEKLDECADQRCLGDSCELPPSEPCLEPAEGRCDGDVVRLCTAGHARAVDCGARGLRCGYGEEGAECLPVIPLAERCATATHCAGNVLVRCEAGRATRVDCAALRAQCTSLPGASAPSCVEVRTVALGGPTCGPCGCPGKQGGESECDGRDEDANGFLDDGLDCGPVPVVAFIVTGSSGQTSHAREDVEAELVTINRMFAGAGREDVEEATGLNFTLADVVELAAPNLLELDQDELQRLIGDRQVHPVRASFYIPVLFTDTIVAGGDTPKPGLSTLPNGTCGGVQEGRGPEVGLLAVAKARYPTTLAHEIGHFLGLCHTHDRQEAEPFVAYSNPQTGKLQTCERLCQGQGDGVCDTPFDPGPELCTYGADCRTSCRVDAAPDARNLMGYYASCRSAFTPEQMRLMQHTLALRRGWQRCLDGACTCQLGGEECPAGMTCRLGNLGGQSVTRCALDGPRAPGADCRDSADCGQGGLCLIEQGSGAQRCARPCLSSSAACECIKVADDLSVCRQDLRTPG